MAIIDPGDFPIDPNSVDGTELAARLNRFKNALYSGNNNATRPPDVTAGGTWTRDAAGVLTLMFFDGTSDIAITGGMLAGDVTIDGNLTFTGNARRIRAGFDLATGSYAGSTWFQSSQPNSFTSVLAVPSGTSTGAYFQGFAGSDPTDSAFVSLGITPTGAQLAVLKTGAAGYLPLSVSAGGAERFRLPATENRFQAKFDDAVVGNRMLFQTTGANTYTAIGVIPTGTAQASYCQLFNRADPDNGANFTVYIDNTVCGLNSSLAGSGTILPLSFGVGALEAMRIATNHVTTFTRNKFGYGPGAGGTVTQITSKATSVTLNKPAGTITTHNDALAANTSVAFQCANSFVQAADTIIASVVWGAGPDVGNYECRMVPYSGDGAMLVILKNISAIPLSEAVIINFTVIKGSRT